MTVIWGHVMRKLCLALGFMAFLAPPASAAAQQRPLIDRWDALVMTGMLTDLGATAITAATLDGAPGLLAQTQDGLNMGLYAKACTPSADPAGPICRGVEGIIGYAPGAGADVMLLSDKLNHDYADGKFMVERDGSIRLSRYLDLAGGVSRANLQAELSDFLGVASAAKHNLWAIAPR